MADLLAVAVKNGVPKHPLPVVRQRTALIDVLGGTVATGPWYALGGVLGAKSWVARDEHLPADAIQIDMVVDGEVRRDVKPTEYAMGQFLQAINYYVNEATK